MKTFLIKKMDNGNGYLFLDDSAKAEYEKIAEISTYQYLTENYVLIPQNEQFNTLYGIEKDEVFSILIPVNAEISFIANVCVYCYDNLYYAIIQKDGEAKAVLLGKLLEGSLSYKGLEVPLSYKGNNYCAIAMDSWKYFIEERQDEKVFNFVIDGDVFSVGPYTDSFTASFPSLLFCKRQDGLYDIYGPYCNKPIEPEEVCEILTYRIIKKVLLWNSDKKAWDLYNNATRWGTNAMYTIDNWNQKDYICLYKVINEKEVQSVTSGVFKMREFYLQIGQNVYFLNKHGEVDFEDNRPCKKLRAFIAWLLRN